MKKLTGTVFAAFCDIIFLKLKNVEQNFPEGGKIMKNLFNKRCI
jgi:hypothetical protein